MRLLKYYIGMRVRKSEPGEIVEDGTIVKIDFDEDDDLPYFVLLDSGEEDWYSETDLKPVDNC